MITKTNRKRYYEPSAPLAELQKTYGSFFPDDVDSAMDNGLETEYSMLERHDTMLKMKETENSKLLAENSRNSAQLKRLESENAELRSEVNTLKETICQLEHNIQEQKQQLQIAKVVKITITNLGGKIVSSSW